MPKKPGRSRLKIRVKSLAKGAAASILGSLPRFPKSLPKPLVKAALAGGVAAFAWSSFSWLVLPWHLMTFSKFENEDVVAAVFRSNARASGMYVLPNAHPPDASGLSENDHEHIAEGARARMRQGPFAFVAVVKDGADPESMVPVVISLLIHVLAAALIAGVVLKARLLDRRDRVTVVAATALTVAVLGHLPYWNWWGFSFGYTFVSVVDTVIGWTIAGYAIAPFTAPSR